MLSKQLHFRNWIKTSGKICLLQKLHILIQAVGASVLDREIHDNVCQNQRALTVIFTVILMLTSINAIV